MKVYISGPITGYPDGNDAAFARAEAELLEAGQEPINPRKVSADHDGPCLGGVFPEHDETHGHRYGCHLKADLEALWTCEAIFMLEGWQGSKGARAEFAVAQALRMIIIYQGDDRG